MKNLEFVEGVEHLHGNFYKVPFAAIITTDKQENNDEYVFSNPRLLTKNGTDVLVDKDLSKSLRENIKYRTLLTPFICRWVEKDGSQYPQLVGGDRRHRALDYLISKKEMVSDPRTPQGSAVPADVAYEYVVCQVFICENDLEAATLSWAENKNRVDLTEGHEIAAVIELRNFSASDDQIMEILQKDSKWLHETDELISSLQNDEETLSLFCEDKIKRGAIKKLLEIDDLEERAKIRDLAMSEAEVVFEEKNKKFDKQKEAIANKKTRAETKKVFAESSGDEKAGNAAQKVLNRVKEREKDIEKKKPSNPKITQKQVEKAATKVGVEDLNSRKLGTVKSINSVLETIQDIINKDGVVDFLEEDFSLDVTLLQLIKMVLVNHALNNFDDFGETLNDWREKFVSESSTSVVDDDEEQEEEEEEEDRREEEDEEEEDEEDDNYGKREETDEVDEEESEYDSEFYEDGDADELLNNADDEDEEDNE